MTTKRKLTPAQKLAQRKARERREARLEFIERQYKKAEADEKLGMAAPDVVYDTMQEQHIYTADPSFDKSRAAIVDMQSLPIKNYNVLPDGTFGITLDEGSAALSELKAGKFCHACHDRQPEMPELWKHKADRLAERIGPRPVWARMGTMCCYCGAKLGIDGDHKNESGVTQITPEQQQLLQEMFGPIRSAEG